jgi:hypothetical protein
MKTYIKLLALNSHQLADALADALLELEDDERQQISAALLQIIQQPMMDA